MFVTKADGTKQLFDRERVIGTCLRLGANREVSEKVAQTVEAGIYEGIETEKILKMIFRQLGKHKPAVKHQIDLREALSLMRPAPNFEHFIQILLREHGYKVIPNQIIRGRCTEHEVDAIASKNGETYIVEVKHHYRYHTETGLDESRILRAVLEDVTEGFELGLNDFRIDKAMIVCNTKLSKQAIEYVECRGIHHIGWSSPRHHDLQTMIEEKKLYPITYLKGLKASDRKKITSAGIILLRDLIRKRPEEIRKETGISEKTLELILKKARTILSYE
ncbi:MAG: restriction endonuclease [Promethearchaeota archaeon]